PLLTTLGHSGTAADVTIAELRLEAAARKDQHTVEPGHGMRRVAAARSRRKRCDLHGCQGQQPVGHALDMIMLLLSASSRLVLQPEFVIFTVRWLAGGSGRHGR